jgi:RNA polymerase sigma factor (sigma-70 family)
MTNELIEQLKKEDSKAQKILYENYSTRMFKLVFRYVTNEQDAASIVNSGFYNIYKNISKFNYIEAKSFMSWMQKIMINESLKFLKRKFEFSKISAKMENEYQSDFVSDKNLNAEEYYKLICSLSEGYRIVFNLYAIEGYSHSEIAQLLQISEGTSRSQLFRARAILKEMILKM